MNLFPTAIPEFFGGDINGDKSPDIVATSYGSNSVSVLINDGRGGFGVVNPLPGLGAPSLVTLGDLNGDGALDMVVPSYFTNGVNVLLGNAKGGFGAAAHFAAGTSPVAVAVGDFDRDGKADLAVANAMGGDASVLRGDGAGGFGAPVDYPTGSIPTAVGVGDANENEGPRPLGARSASRAARGTTLSMLRSRRIPFWRLSGRGRRAP